MNFEELKAQIAEIVAICKDVPDEFRARCFEILLGAALQQHKKPDQKNDTKDLQEAKGVPDEDDGEDEQQESLVIPGSVKAFLRRQSLADGLLEKLVMIEGEEFHWIKEPSHKNVRRGQNEWALLIALKNALLGGALSVDPEDVRSAAQDKGYYDAGNFAGNFKKDPYQTWYKGEMVPQGAAQTLAKDGEAALAELIKALTSS